MKNYFVYIVECADGHYYVGVTSKIEARIWEHNSGQSRTSYTFSRRPVRLVYSEAFRHINDAIFAEKRIKGWSRRKKEALIRGDWRTIRQLSRNSILRQAQDDSGDGILRQAQDDSGDGILRRAQDDSGEGRPSTSSG